MYQRTTHEYASQQSGFTLVEVIVICAINTMLLLVITWTVQFIYKSNAYTFAQANEIEAARRGIAIWTSDAREMTLAANGAYPVAVLETNRMGFYSDVDRDLSVEYVEYSLSSTTLTKKTYNPVGNPAVYSTSTPDLTEIVSLYVQNSLQGVPMFGYYDSGGVALASPSAMLTDVRYITLKIIVNIDPVRSPGEFMLQTSAAPRNLKDNL
jgi:Tfp pilus assembly protein PilV